MFLIKEISAGIKNVTPIILVCIILSLVTNCEKEKEHSRSYPQVRTNPVTNITDKGATFNGNIYTLGTEAITDHGFVWGEESTLDLNDDKTLLGPLTSGGDFSADIVSSLAKTKEYYVKAFVKTAEHIVYGPPVTFISLGSGAPVITGFRPSSAEWLDTIEVSGKNFSWIKADNIVRLNQIQCTTLEASDTVIKILVSSDLADLKSVISVELKGNHSTLVRDTFRLIAPVIKDYSPHQAMWGDTIIITGDHFESHKLQNEISATINGYPSAVIWHEFDSLSIIMPYQLSAIENTLSVKFNKLVISIPEKVTLKPPVIYNISPKEGTWGNIITMNGRFHPDKARNIITMGDAVERYITSNNTGSIQFYTGDLTKGVSPVILHSDPFTIVSPDSFRLYPPVIDSISPLKGRPGTGVHIYGKHIYWESIPLPVVLFGSTPGQITYNTENHIVCTVPSPMNDGPVNISLTIASQTAVYKDPYTVENPVITNVYPLTATFNDEITIEGQNLNSIYYGLNVTFTEYNGGVYVRARDAEIVSASPTRIVVKVPVTLDSIPQRIEVRDYFNNIASYTNSNFILAPPEILSVSPAVLKSGETVTISGRNFHPLVSGNEVYWGGYKLQIESASPGQIVASIPGTVPPGINKIILKVGGYTRYSAGAYELQF